ncbi:MAG: hypothetical protein JEZ07_19465 [Phycisphaerae bacterium]|nr:hypothetical protein [Phycisphaerae bacterium]
MFGYSYDKNSNITNKTFNHRPSTPDNFYAYDDMNRLTGTTYLDDVADTDSFSYDDLGNL